jgi:hypothetical protein
MDFHFLQTPTHKSAGETPRPKMLEDIQEHMRALIAQHGSALVALATLRQHLEAQQNDEQTHSLENHVPHINVQAEFIQDTSKSACERSNRLQRERHAKQCTELAEPSKMLKERSNCLCPER